MILCYLAVGSNLGDRENYLDQARQLISKTSGIYFLQASRIYETEPVGGPVQGKYLNAVLEIETELAPETLLAVLLEIEKKLGRIRTVPNGPRTIDLDILFYGEQVIHLPGLQVPHPRLHMREFVLKPLMDLCPSKMHPQLHQTVRELYGSLGSK